MKTSLPKFLALALLFAIGASIAVGGKDYLPKLMRELKKDNSEGKVVGVADTKIAQEELQRQIDEIKKDVMQLKPEDIAKQEAIKKILNDLEGVKEKASESAKMLDMKGNICEEAKKRFCQ